MNGATLLFLLRVKSIVSSTFQYSVNFFFVINHEHCHSNWVNFKNQFIFKVCPIVIYESKIFKICQKKNEFYFYVQNNSFIERKVW